MENDSNYIPSVNQILKVVELEFDISISEITGKSHLRTTALARHTAIFLCRKLRRMSFPEIAMVFGMRDHTGPLNAYYRIFHQVSVDSQLKERVFRIEEECRYLAKR